MSHFIKSAAVYLWLVACCLVVGQDPFDVPGPVSAPRGLAAADVHSSAGGNPFRDLRQLNRNRQLAGYVCALRPDRGPCSGRLKRWFFNCETRQCQVFYYSGCWGNANNFRLPQDCQMTCNEQTIKQLIKNRLNRRNNPHSLTEEDWLESSQDRALQGPGPNETFSDFNPSQNSPAGGGTTNNAVQRLFSQTNTDNPTTGGASKDQMLREEDFLDSPREISWDFGHRRRPRRRRRKYSRFGRNMPEYEDYEDDDKGPDEMEKEYTGKGEKDDDDDDESFDDVKFNALARDPRSKEFDKYIDAVSRRQKRMADKKRQRGLAGRRRRLNKKSWQNDRERRLGGGGGRQEKPVRMRRRRRPRYRRLIDPETNQEVFLRNEFLPGSSLGTRRKHRTPKMLSRTADMTDDDVNKQPSAKPSEKSPSREGQRFYYDPDKEDKGTYLTEDFLAGSALGIRRRHRKNILGRSPDDYDDDDIDDDDDDDYYDDYYDYNTPPHRRSRSFRRPSMGRMQMDYDFDDFDDDSLKSFGRSGPRRFSSNFNRPSRFRPIKFDRTPKNMPKNYEYESGYEYDYSYDSRKNSKPKKKTKKWRHTEDLDDNYRYPSRSPNRRPKKSGRSLSSRSIDDDIDDDDDDFFKTWSKNSFGNSDFDNNFPRRFDHSDFDKPPRFDPPKFDNMPKNMPKNYEYESGYDYEYSYDSSKDSKPKKKRNKWRHTEDLDDDDRQLTARSDGQTRNKILRQSRGGNPNYQPIPELGPFPTQPKNEKRPRRIYKGKPYTFPDLPEEGGVAAG